MMMMETSNPVICARCMRWVAEWRARVIEKGGGVRSIAVCDECLHDLESADGGEIDLFVDSEPIDDRARLRLWKEKGWTDYVSPDGTWGFGGTGDFVRWMKGRLHGR